MVKVQWVARIGLARQAQGARRSRCGTSSTTSNEEIARNPYAPKGFRRRRGICCVGAPQRCTTSPASRRLASAPAALGTRPAVLLPRAVRVERQLGLFRTRWCYLYRMSSRFDYSFPGSWSGFLRACTISSAYDVLNPRRCSWAMTALYVGIPSIR